MQAKHMLVIYFVVVISIFAIYWFFFRSPKTSTTVTKTTTTTVPTSVTLEPDQNWLSVAGYSQSFNTCKNLCLQHQQSGCSNSTAQQYCNAAIAVDLDKDGTIQQNDRGHTPFGGFTCENSMRCFDVISECRCGSNVLNINSCLNSYMDQDFSIECTMPSA